MKKIIVAVFALMAISFSVNAQKSTYYAYVETWSNGYVNKSIDNTKGTAFFSDIIVIHTDDNMSLTETKLEMQYSSALKAHLSSDEYHGYIVKGRVSALIFKHDAKARATKSRNDNIGELKRKGTKIRYFSNFEYID